MRVDRLFHLFAISLVAVFLAGCSGAPSWMQGEWIFDSDRTQKGLSEMIQKPGSHPLPSTQTNAFPNVINGGMGPALGMMLASMLIPQLKDSETDITGKDIITTVRGQGKALSYEIIKKSSQECTVKESDGTVMTYYRDGDEIYSFSTGGIAAIKFYMKRKK